MGKLTEVCLKDPNTDLLLIAGVPECETLQTLPDEIGKPFSIYQKILKLKKKYPERYFFVACESGHRYQAFREGCLKNGIPAFKDVAAASRIMAKLVNVYKSSQ